MEPVTFTPPNHRRIISMLLVLMGLVLTFFLHQQNEHREAGKRIVTVSRDGRFEVHADGTVLDKKTGLLWAGTDSGRDLTWEQARRFGKLFRGGGYNDWRLPALEELRTLYTPESNYKVLGEGAGVPLFLPSYFLLSTGFLWAAEAVGTDEAAGFDFVKGRGFREPRQAAMGLRAMVVRTHQPPELDAGHQTTTARQATPAP